MELKVINDTDQEGYLTQELLLDGEEFYSFYPLWECPEDACLERDMLGADDLIHLFKMGYKAGKNNTPVEYVTVEVKKEEEQPT